MLTTKEEEHGWLLVLQELVKMVAPAIAAAAAPVVVQSATSDDGLLNKLFKLSMLVGFLLLAAFGFFILNYVISIADVVGAAGSFALTFFDFVLPGSGLATGIWTLATGFFAAFGFGGRE